VRTWIFSAALFTTLAIVFFSRSFHTKNWAFSSWLIFGSVLNLLFAFAVAAKFSLARIDPWLGPACWIFTGLALGVAVLRRGEPVNGIIIWGLVANIGLHLFLALNLIPSRDKSLYWLVSNLAGLGPTVYMLAAFAWLHNDLLPLWLHDNASLFAATRAALGFARAMLS
jgi:hypothetical protein